MDIRHQLLQPADPAPAGGERLHSRSPFLLLADHAGNAVPKRLGDLGISAKDMNRHIGIDIGIHGVSQKLSELLDAPYLYQRYSRLVIDCNRAPGNPASITPISDSTRIPANQELSAEDIAMRESEIFWPYQKGIGKQLEAMQKNGHFPTVIAMHSFTPKHGDYPSPRPWHVGVLFNRDERLARALISFFEQEDDLNVGINQPYAVEDNVDYAIPVHCERTGLLHVELEIRQDLIESPEGQRAWAERLARLLPLALNAVGQVPLKKMV